MRDCVEKVNAELAGEALMVAETQIHRFLVLHKELDPDDDELTRTRKVRRKFVAEKYALLIEALYGGKASQFIATQVKFEDGRTGTVSADLRIVDAKTYPRAGGGSVMDDDSEPLAAPAATQDRRGDPRPEKHFAGVWRCKGADRYFLRRARSTRSAPSSGRTAPARARC